MQGRRTEKESQGRKRERERERVREMVRQREEEGEREGERRSQIPRKSQLEYETKKGCEMNREKQIARLDGNKNKERKEEQCERAGQRGEMDRKKAEFYKETIQIGDERSGQQNI